MTDFRYKSRNSDTPSNRLIMTMITTFNGMSQLQTIAPRMQSGHRHKYQGTVHQGYQDCTDHNYYYIYIYYPTTKAHKKDLERDSVR